MSAPNHDGTPRRWIPRDLQGRAVLEIQPRTLLALCELAQAGIAIARERGASTDGPDAAAAVGLIDRVVAQRARIDELALQRLSEVGSEEAKQPAPMSDRGHEIERASLETITMDLMRAHTAARHAGVSEKTIVRNVGAIEIDGVRHFWRDDVEAYRERRGRRVRTREQNGHRQDA